MIPQWRSSCQTGWPYGAPFVSSCTRLWMLAMANRQDVLGLHLHWASCSTMAAMRLTLCSFNCSFTTPSCAVLTGATSSFKSVGALLSSLLNGKNNILTNWEQAPWELDALNVSIYESLMVFSPRCYVAVNPDQQFYKIPWDEGRRDSNPWRNVGLNLSNGSHVDRIEVVGCYFHS